MSNPSTVGIVTDGDFGEELRRLRTRAGLTLRSLAERVAFDYSYLAQVERGDRAGSATLAHRCDHTLGAHGHLVRLFADQRRQQLMDRAAAMPDCPDPVALSIRAHSLASVGDR